MTSRVVATWGTSPPNEQTDKTKNITFPKTTYAGCNYLSDCYEFGALLCKKSYDLDPYWLSNNL